MERPTILAVIPAYNEARRIGIVVRQACAHLPVVVVDDGSIDGTGLVAQENGAAVHRLEPNGGKGAALQAGFRLALEAGAEAVITLDADGQHDPAEIPLFLDAWDSRHADLVIGARDFNDMPLVRRAANTVGRWSFSWAMGQRVVDNQSGYRLLSRRMMEAVLESKTGGFEFEVEMIVVCIRRGYLLDWVPIKTIYAGEGSHIRPWQHTVNFTRLVLDTRRRMRG
jgi:glycosyltransferase involved in cell wall biosynthesis